MTDNAYKLPVFPQNDRASQAWARVAPQLERLHDEFMGQWRQALAAIIPANVQIDDIGLECKTYSQYVKEAPAFSDIQVYEIESMQSLCAWSLDVGFVSAAVDSMFGGTGRIPAREAMHRSRSPIETGVRRRLLETLATAYESAWQAVHPIRLNPLRQEALVSALRLTAPAEHVIYARLRVRINQHDFAVEQCMPLRALEVLHPTPSVASSAPPQAPATTRAAVSSDPPTDPAVPPRLREAQVEVVALLGELQLSVAQLMSLSIGQVVPFQMNDRVPLQVDGVRVVSGRSGMRNGRHAVKVELSSAANLSGLKAEFTPFNQGILGSPEPTPAPDARIDCDIEPMGTLNEPAATSTDHPEDPRHEPEQPQ